MSKSLDRLTLLHTFVRIAERGAISAAARDLGLSQASASRQLAELEERLGVQLALRTTHNFSLTEAGLDCLADARNLLSGWEALVERHADDNASLSGKLKVVAPVALGQLDLGDAALAFQAAHPDVEVIWDLQDGPIRFAEVGCDLWVKIGKVPDETLIVRPLGTVERLIVAAPELILGRAIQHPDDLADLPCAALSPFEGGTIRLADANGEPASITAKVGLATNNIFSAKKAALTGLGYAIMPRWFVASELVDGRLVDILPNWRAAELTINAAYLPARRQTRRLKALIDHLSDAVAAMPGVQTVSA
ncbi:LysR family transcriptional regulator [Hoeflea poritis]|uniref:LysR family transcriptional regulator n=1 Tax=Hoeflea poritis TaxID=2993659 RepID=A0ABT4VV18_9HYPH|nr:LysR family transcriptional regulator [Hoeflea poritis]MDA4847867.1 LysR family transcriptional regulator [Hoeflea poritis]